MWEITRRQSLQVAGAGLAASMFGLGKTAAAAGDVVDLTYDWTYNGPPGTIAEFWKTVQQRLNDQDHGVKLGDVAETTFENLYSTIEAQVLAKSGSDVATFYSDYHTFRSAFQGAIAPIDDLVSDTTKEHWLVNDSSMFNDQTWGHPVVLEIAILAVNRKLMEQAGVDLGDRFESYDAFIEACDKLKAAGIRPIQAGTSDGFNAEKWLYMLEFQVCDNITDIVGGILGSYSVDEPFFKFPREQLPRLVQNYMNPNPQNDTEEMATNAFLAGEAAMTMMYLSPIIAPDTPSEFDVVGFPAADVRFNRPAVGVADNLILMNYSDSKEAAGRLFDFLGEAEQVQLWWDLTGSLPANDLLDSSALPGPAKKVWDWVLEERSKPYGLWWPGNYPPSSLFTFQYGVTQDQFAGMSAEEAGSQTETIFRNWREQHPSEVEILSAYNQALAKTAGVTPR